MGNIGLLNLASAIFGFTVAGMLILSNSHNRKINFLLGIAFAVSSYRSLSIFLLDHGLVRNTFVMGTVSFAYYLIAPAFYLYFRQVINDGKPFEKKDLKHLIIPFFMALLPFFYFFMNILLEGRAYLPEQTMDTSQAKPFRLYISVLEHAFLLTLTSVVYAVKSWKLTLKHLKHSPDEHPQVKTMRTWIIGLLILCSMLVIVLFFTAILTWATGVQTKLSISHLGAIRNLVIITLFSRVIVKRDLLFGIPQIPSNLPTVIEKLEIASVPAVPEFHIEKAAEPSNENSIEYPEDFDEYGWVIDNIGIEESNLETEKIALYIREVTEYVKKKPFLDPDFNMKYISRELDVPHYHIEYLFRYYNRYAFTEFRNLLRVRHVIEKFGEGVQESLSLEGIGKEAGFSSRSSFFRVFKQITGKSPKQYAEGSDDEEDDED